MYKQMKLLNEMHKQMKIIKNQNKIFKRLNAEVWRKIEGYPNYSISTIGHVRNDCFGKILKPQMDGSGYYSV